MLRGSVVSLPYSLTARVADSVRRIPVARPNDPCLIAHPTHNQQHTKAKVTPSSCRR